MPAHAHTHQRENKKKSQCISRLNCISGSVTAMPLVRVRGRSFAPKYKHSLLLPCNYDILLGFVVFYPQRVYREREIVSM